MTVIETAPTNGHRETTAKANLVVVGNGMAGIRAIEEVLALSA